MAPATPAITETATAIRIVRFTTPPSHCVGGVRSAFRVQFTTPTDGDGVTDAMFFGSAVNPTLTHRPTLEVTHGVP